MTVLRERKKARARGEIIAAATDLFARHGYEAVTMRDVAETAGVSYQTVYNYFPSKARVLSEILLAAGRTVEERLRRGFEDGAHGAWPGLDVAIDNLVAASFEILESHDRSYWRTVSAEMVRNPGAFDAFGAFGIEFRDGFVHMLRAARDAGEIAPDVDLGVLAAVLLGLTTHARLRAILLPEDEEPELQRELRRQLELVLSPYRRKRGASVHPRAADVLRPRDS